MSIAAPHSRSAHRRLTALRFGALLLAGSTGAHAATWVVDSTSADPALNACTAAAGDCSFPGAVSRLATTGDSIVFTVASSLATLVAISRDVVIDAAGASLPKLRISTTLGFATVTVRNARWQNLNDTANVGGALNIGRNQVVTIEDSEFLNNQSYLRGGAIYNDGALVVSRSRFTGNFSGGGGSAIHSTSFGRLTVLDSTFRANGTINANTPTWQLGEHGAISADGTLDIRGCLFVDNHSLFTSAVRGGALTRIYNSTFSGNQSYQYRDSGTLLLGGPARIANSTIAGNIGFTSGGVFVLPASDTQVVNTLIANNTGANPDVSGRVYSHGNNLIRNRTGALVEGNIAGTDIYDADPRLVALASNGGATLTMALQADSPALNAGSECVLAIDGCGEFPHVVLSTDQRGSGYSRARGEHVDIGAFESPQPDMVITNADSGVGSLRQVLADTATGGTVVFSPSYFSQPRTIALASALLVNRSLTIQGPGSALVTLDGGNLDRVLKIDAPAALTLSGVRLTRGNPGASNSGGGVLVNGGTLSASDIVIDNSRGNQGGCIYNNGSLILIRARLSTCQASFGAGLLNESGKSANVYDSVIENSISSGGAGGVGNNGSMLLERVTVAGNSATFGGGMINAATATLYNVTLSANTATTNKAGGIYIGVGSSMTVNHATITANTALTFAGGGIWNDGGVINLRNSIIAGNFGAGANVDAVGSISGLGYNLIGTSGGYSFSGGSDLSGNQINVPARLGVLAGNGGFGATHAPLHDSPVIDAGGSGLPIDARGLLRPVDFTGIGNAGGGNGSDIGAYELQISTPTLVVASVSAATGPGAVSVAFSWAANGGPAATSYTAICGARSAAGPASPIVVTGLPIGTAVTCAVTASNAMVSGIPSAPSNSVVPSTVPDAPTITSVTAGNANVSVAFSPPGSNGGSLVSGYTARCGAQSNSGGGSPIVVSGLANGTAVTCTVIATNAMGNSAPSAASTSVTPSTVPNPPTALVVSPGDTTVSVSFTPPQNDGGSAISGYTATCGSRSNSGAAAPIVVSGLTNGVAVSCTAVATNARGDSVASAPSNSVTPGLPPGAPTIGSAVAGNGQVSVVFTAPASNGGSAITGYTATCGAQSQSGTGSPIVVAGLVNGTPVTCTVIATNALGNGPASAPSASVTPATVPGAPTGVVATRGNAQLSVAFVAPTSNGGSAITGYTATCGAQSQSGTGSPIVVAGLVNGTPVTCTVIATNAVGNSAASAPSASVTPATVPGAPTGVVATRGNAQLSVAFGAPTSNGGSAITGYTATCGAQSQSGTASPIVVAGLTNGVAASCTVLATNAVGNSPASVPSASVTPATVPDAPGMFEATAGNASASVRFSPPASNGGAPVEDYTATCVPDGASITGSTSPLTVTGLSNGTRYDCVVTARNAVGSGPVSVPSSVIPTAVASADLAVTMSNGSRFVTGGAPTTYTITLSNPGPSGVARVRVLDELDPEFSNPSWTCTAQGGAVCAASGNGGPLDERVDLPLGASLTFLLTATVAPLPETPVSNLVSVTLPTPFNDPNLQNNVATDGPDVRGLFRNGFD